ncbi:MAG: hypothetical protein JWN78_2261 [Bacteroidota bacterium]|nr:hypothetical protein [Bacteroidota bacterium]
MHRNNINRSINKIVITFLVLMNLSSCKETATGTQKALIIFHTSACFGYCPVYHLQVNNDKTARLFAEVVYKNASTEIDSSETGYFVGSVSDTLFNKLKIELAKIDLDNLNFDGQDCCDAPIITIIVYYDGKRKFLRSMFPPAIADNLISVLNQICVEGNFTRTSETFHLEGQE